MLRSPTVLAVLLSAASLSSALVQAPAAPAAALEVIVLDAITTNVTARVWRPAGRRSSPAEALVENAILTKDSNRLQAFGVGDSDPNTTTPPAGAAIWNKSQEWVSIRRWHPSGMVANLNDGIVSWNDASYVSLQALLVLSCVCYPAILIFIVMILTLVLSMCLAVRPVAEPPSGTPHPQRPHRPEVAVPPQELKDRLTPSSQRIYLCWVWFCSTIPSQFVFGVPFLLVCLSRPYPREVFIMLTLVTATMMFSNGIYMVIFATSSILRMQRSMQYGYRGLLWSKSTAAVQAGGCRPRLSGTDVHHWVLLPQYKEDVEVVSIALSSIARSSLARAHVGIVLGMEAREAAAAEKAELLRSSFQAQFREILVTSHPKDLPNDPPGKASNVSWAFKELVEHLASSRQDTEHVVLTIADADSEFHDDYFEGLSHLYCEADDTRRDFTIWQSPVFHLKNYHRQPMPVIVGTMFTSMQELAMLSDPHAIRFPYSTYSMSLHLAKTVGGWDPDWIAEDWHMGIKCYLLTMGRSSVEPLLLPTANYTPEDTSWWKTIDARWSQAKRHALGFSDLAYYFMVLPLVFGHSMSESMATGKSDSLRQLWFMLFSGMTLVVKLTNVHVIIGVLTTYGALSLLLKFLMNGFFLADRRVDLLMEKMHFCTMALTGTSLGCMISTTVLFNMIYVLLKSRMEGEAFRSIVVHWLYTLVAFSLFGPLYFLGLGLAVWKAALNVLVKRSFEYEVASKPTTERRMA